MSTNQAEEQTLYRCGPAGVEVSSARPGLFVVAQRNNTEVVATDRRLVGVRMLPRIAWPWRGRGAGQVVFSIPWADILEVERADFLLNHALWIRYRAGDGIADLGITCGLLWHKIIAGLEEVIRHSCQTEPRAEAPGS